MVPSELYVGKKCNKTLDTLHAALVSDYNDLFFNGLKVAWCSCVVIYSIAIISYKCKIGVLQSHTA